MSASRAAGKRSTHSIAARLESKKIATLRCIRGLEDGECPPNGHKTSLEGCRVGPLPALQRVSGNQTIESHKALQTGKEIEVTLLDPGQRAPTMGEAHAPSHFATSILALLVPQHRNTQHCTEGGPVFGIQVLEGSSGIAGNTTNRHRKGRCSGYVTRPPQCRPPFL